MPSLLTIVPYLPKSLILGRFMLSYSMGPRNTGYIGSTLAEIELIDKLPRSLASSIAGNRSLIG